MEAYGGPRAGFWRRFAAALIDGIIVGVVSGILQALVFGIAGRRVSGQRRLAELADHAAAQSPYRLV